MVPGFKARTNRHCLEVLFRRYNLTLALALGRRAGSTSGLTFVDSPKAMDLTKRQLSDLIDALEGAIEDAECYFRSGFADRDYKGNENDLAEYKNKVGRWAELHDMLTKSYIEG